jgi:hypothetical protein
MDNRWISQLRAFTARMLGLFRSRKRDREFDEEMQAHLQLLADRFVAQGCGATSVRKYHAVTGRPVRMI